jgi:hypothetical protein
MNFSRFVTTRITRTSWSFKYVVVNRQQDNTVYVSTISSPNKNYYVTSKIKKKVSSSTSITNQSDEQNMAERKAVGSESNHQLPNSIPIGGQW